MNVRSSKQRTAVQRAVGHSGQHPTAREVFDAVRRELPNVSLATVYRNLTYLVSEGELRAVHTGHLPVRYEGVIDDHGHFVCDACGQICDLSIDSSRPVRALLEGQGYAVERSTLTIHGLCPGCRAERAHG